MRIANGVALAELDRLIASETDECQLWPFAKSIDGYGKIRYGGRTQSAHRVVLFLKTGERPSVVRHKCDTRLCCKPRHLLAGTHMDNMRDRNERDRLTSKLTRSDVSEIRRIFDTDKSARTSDVATRFNVSNNTVRSIVARKTWTHI